MQTTLPGQHGHRATQDGETLIVHDVPIFCTCTIGDDEFAEEWIRKAYEHAQYKDDVEGYRPPVHVRHHMRSTAEFDNGGDVVHAGEFRVTHCAPTVLDGIEVIAVFADLHLNNPDIAKLVLSGQLPHRSIEIKNAKVEKFSSLSLLSHEPPALKFANMTVVALENPTENDLSLEKIEPPPLGQDLATNQALVTFAEPSSRFLTLCERSDMTTQAKPAKPARSVKLAEHEEPKGNKDEKKPPAKKDEDSKDEETQAEEGETFDLQGLITSIGDKTIAVGDLEALAEAISTALGTAGETMPENEDHAAPNEDRAPAGVAASEARKDARIRALEIDRDQRDAADIRAKDVSEFLTRMSGRPLGSDPEKRFLAYHKAHGPKAFKAFSDELASNLAPVLDDRRRIDVTNFAAGGQGQVPGVALRFQDGPRAQEAVVLASEAAEQFRQLSERGHVRCTEEAFVDRAMKQKGFAPSSPTT